METTWRPSLAVAFLIVGLLLSPALATAQTSMGAVNGTVADSTGGVLPGATVTLVNTETGIESVRVTNQSGYFTFINCGPAPTPSPSSSRD